MCCVDVAAYMSAAPVSRPVKKETVDIAAPPRVPRACGVGVEKTRRGVNATVNETRPTVFRESMIAGRAAASANVRRKAKEMRKEHAAMKAEEKIQVDAWFKKFDTDQTNVLSREQLTALFTHVCGVAPSERALEDAMKVAEGVDVNGDGNIDATGVSRSRATSVVSTYKAYVQEEKWLDGVFDEFDTNKSGQLEPGQLQALLQKVSPEATVTDEDTKYVLSLVDKSKTGTILRSEALAAAATWKKLILEGKPHAKSRGCAVL